MDEMISKQAAIDAVNSLTYPSSLMDVKRKLIELPSAQPDIVYCKDCIKYRPEKCSCKNDVTDVLGFGRHWGGDDFCSRGTKG